MDEIYCVYDNIMIKLNKEVACEKQTDLTVWVNKNEHIVIFWHTGGYVKMICICNLCKSGCRIL